MIKFLMDEIQQTEKLDVQEDEDTKKRKTFLDSFAYKTASVTAEQFVQMLKPKERTGLGLSISVENSIVIEKQNDSKRWSLDIDPEDGFTVIRTESGIRPDLKILNSLEEVRADYREWSKNS